MAIAWALEHSKFFTMGCDDLTIVTDHSPLYQLLGDKCLDEIANFRLFRLKQRTLPWKFTMKWLPGKSNVSADALSRFPVGDEDAEVNQVNSYVLEISPILGTNGDRVEYSLLESIASNFSINFAITWKMVQDKTQVELSDLFALIQNGITDMPDHLMDYNEYRRKLYISDGVIMYDDRILVPPSLRKDVLASLHSAHQGVTGMILNAQNTVFWPGITVDISFERAKCRTCNKIAPSQAKLPPVEPLIPTTPFEAIVSDYFELEGFLYLVLADRLSGWPEVYHIKVNSKNSGSSGLIKLLRRFFATFGVPSEISSDRGPEYASKMTQEFLSVWGVTHRLSSAYLPQSNGRAEVAVKSMKRLLRENISLNGDLNTNSFLRAILMYRNTPDPICKLSPSQIVFGRSFPDSLPRLDKTKNIFSEKIFRPEWRASEAIFFND